MSITIIHRETVIDITRSPFNARADGATDSWQSFQDAFEEAANRGGAIIDGLSGSFFLDTATHGPLISDAYANVTLRGQGWNSTELLCSGPFLDARNSSDNWTIDGLHIKSNAATNTDDGIVVDYPRRWLITRCQFEGFGNDSVRFEGGLQSELVFNRFFAKDASNTNGHAGVYITETGAAVVATTMRSIHNYVATGKQYGLLSYRVNDSIWSSDIVENCDIGMSFARCSGELHYPYTESIGTTSIELLDCSKLFRTGGRFYSGPTEVDITWSGTASSDRYTTQFGTGSYYNDHTLGRDVTIGRNGRIGGSLSVGTYELMTNTTEPATPTGGGVFWVEGGALKYKGSSGTVTTLASA